MIMLFRFSDMRSLNANLQRLISSLSCALVIKLLRRFLFGLTKVVCRLLPPAPSQLASTLTCIRIGFLTMYRRLLRLGNSIT